MKRLRSFWNKSVFIKALKSQKGLIAGAALCMIGQTALVLLQPWPIRAMIDHIVTYTDHSGHYIDRYSLTEFVIASIRGLIGQSHIQFLFKNIGLLALIYIANALLLFLQNITLARVGQNITLDLRKKLFNHLICMPHSFFEKSQTGDLTSRITHDTADTQAMLESVLTVLVRSIPTIIGIIIITFTMDRIYASTFLMVIPVIYMANLQLSRRTKKALKEQRRVEGVLSSTVQEAFSYHKAVVCLSLEDDLVEDVTERGRLSAERGVQAGRYQGILSATMDLTMGITSLFILFVGVLRIIHGCLTVGQLMVFLSYLNNLFKPIREVSKFASRWAKSTAALERIEELFSLTPARMQVNEDSGAFMAPRFRGYIRFHNVTFGYDPSRPVLKDLNIAISAGEKVALVGDSGSGKSTILQLLMRLYDPNEGMITIDGQDIRKFSLNSLRSQMAVVLQDSYIFRMSIKENIAIAKPGATEEEVVAAAQAAGAHEFIMKLPNQYDTILGEGGSGLSGGQKRRLAIARAFLRNAPIVLLDEPTVGLDASTERQVMEALARLTGNRTTIMVTHQLHTVVDFDRIIVLSAGKVVESGKHQDLLAQKGLYYRLWQAGQSKDSHHSPEAMMAIGAQKVSPLSP
ncbi:ABC transporter ATP-binding protein [Thermodesulforhabdus norvegica]|uniref:ATP-binding cassette, subfamily B n=1 Tax=Thermodesulforhabdus norvegica TaxID=39841 RepID=A0A1I4QHP6_9BACT|nr:ABC transporter ATP-binding protein [Thermodesulforhabdus norvegica]SFM39544.1 ATP-binding cassette, subfamily B [Thermodesulforhabdus norvegica]